MLSDLSRRLRASAIVPAIAVAAAVSGLARNVRPPFPCRPSKLRLLVLTAYWPGRELIAVHRDAHRAARLAPLGARRAEDLVESLGLRLALHLLRARHDEHPHARRDAPSAHARRPPGGDRRCASWCSCRGRRRPPACRAALARRERHVVERLLERARSLRCIGDMRGVGTGASTAIPIPGLVPYVIIGVSVPASRTTVRSYVDAVVACEACAIARAPHPSRAPCGACGRPARYSYVVSSGAIIPARAPASIDMLQTVIRSSIDSAGWPSRCTRARVRSRRRRRSREMRRESCPSR